MYFLFLLFWIVCNGKVTVEILLVGMILCLGLYIFVCKFMDYRSKTDWNILKKLFQGLQYIAVLVWEIVKANAMVLRYIFTLKEEVEPRLVSFDVDLKTQNARVALANSITLTPGTITVDLQGKHYVVYCLDKELAVGLEDSHFVKRLQKMEEET